MTTLAAEVLPELESSGAPEPLGFLPRAGIAVDCIRAFDWSTTSIGAIATWPQSLRTVVGILLRSRQPMFLWWGPDLVQIYNDAYMPSFGVGKHPLAMGQRGRDCWEDIWPIIGSQIEAVMSRGESTWNEDQVVPTRRNGRVEDVYWTYGYSAVMDEAGAVGGTLVVCMETTARVVAARRLAATRALSERLVGDADLEGVLRSAIGAFGEMPLDLPFALALAVDGDSVTLTAACGLDDDQLPRHERFLRDELRAALPSGYSERAGSPLGLGEGRLSMPPASAHSEAIPAFVVPLWSPPRVGVVGFLVMGLNGRCDFDAHYRGHLEQLGEIVSRACAREAIRVGRENMQRQLIVADRMSSIGTLASRAAHEINNPLAALTANLDLVIEDLQLPGVTASDDSRATLEMVLQARESAERVRKIVRELKTFSRRDHETLAAVALEPLIERAIAMAFRQVQRPANVVTRLGPTPLVEADEGRLVQIFNNLIVNAAQALAGSSQAGEIRIETSTDSSGRAVIEVSDSGPGIDAAVVGRIFEPFFTTKPISGGVGLGLTVCHNIVTGLGGNIEVIGTPGRGAKLRVVLPPASLQSSLAAPGAADMPAMARRAAVLVVDDEPSVAAIIVRVLREHAVTTAGLAREALAHLAAGREFDVIISDLMMPETSGMELFDQLQLQFPLAAERVVFMSGGTFTDEAGAFLARVTNRRFEKPFDPKEVRALVQTLVDEIDARRRVPPIT